MRKPKNKGFTLLEVMLAVTILSVGLVMVVRSYVTSLQAIKISKDFLIANLLLEEKIWERQEKQTRSEEVIPEEKGEFETPFNNFSYEISFTEQEDLPAEYKGTLYKSTFEVSWQQRKRKHTTSSVTFLHSEKE